MPTRAKLAVILHADESLAHERIRDAFRRLRETIGAHDGQTHELRGDALVAEFSRASDALSAAVDFQGGTSPTTLVSGTG